MVAPRTPATHGLRVPGVAVCAEEADELDDHDERAGGCFGEREAVDHFSGEEPVIDVDRALCNEGQYGVRATEGDHCGA